MTPKEHAVLKGIDPYIIAETAKTAAHRLLGNSICTPPWVLLGEALGLAINKWIEPKVTSLAA